MNKRFSSLRSPHGRPGFGLHHLGPGTGDPAARRKAIDAAVDSSLSTLFQQVPDSRDLVGRAAGVLVFPNVVEAGFVVGASRGQGALRVGGRTVSYHATTSGSLACRRARSPRPCSCCS